MEDKSASINNSTFHGNLIQGDTTGNVTFSQSNSHNVSEQEKTLAKAAEEIQLLLNQLEKENPVASDAEKIIYVNDETTPSFKRRAVAALQAGGETAIEEFFDNSYINIGKAVIKSWIKPE